MLLPLAECLLFFLCLLGEEPLFYGVVKEAVPAELHWQNIHW